MSEEMKRPSNHFKVYCFGHDCTSCPYFGKDIERTCAEQWMDIHTVMREGVTSEEAEQAAQEEKQG